MSEQAQNTTVSAQPRKTSICAIIGTIFGAVALLLSFIPIINNFAAIFGVIGFILGVVGLVGVLRKKRAGKVLSIIALVLSAAGIAVTLAMQAAASKALDDLSDSLNSSSSSQQAENSEKSDSEKNASQEKKDDKADEPRTEGDLGKIHVKIASVAKGPNDYLNRPTLLVTYEWTNNSNDNVAFGVVAIAKAFQNGKELETTILNDGAAQGYESGGEYKEIQPGASSTLVIAYVDQDSSPVDVEVEGFLNTKDPKLAGTYPLQ